MFSAAAVLVVVGSAFAFGTRSSSKLFCINSAQTQCDVVTSAVSLTDQGLGVNSPSKRCAATIVPATQCPATIIYNAD